MLIYSCLEIITLILNVTLPTTTTNPRRVRLSAADEIIRHLIADQILITSLSCRKGWNRQTMTIVAAGWRYHHDNQTS